MEIFEGLMGIINALVAVLNGILDLIEKLFSPVIDLINRWNSLFGRF
jgi:hypothetical protein